MATVIVLIFFGIATVAAAVAPLLLPWPQRLRWMIFSCATPDPVWMGWPNQISLREVVLHDVDARVGGVIVRLVTPDVPAELLVRWVPATAGDMDQLSRWATDGGPLLLVRTPEGSQSLHSDTGSVEGLQPADFGVLFVEPRVHSN